MIKQSLVKSILSSSLLFFLACDQNDDLAGGSTDVETGGIAGVAKIAGDSLITSGTILTLNQVQDNLLADSLESVTADSLGQFEFNDLEPGTYSVESYQASTGKRNLNLLVEVSEDSVTYIESIMYTPGSITLIDIPDSVQSSEYSLYIPELRLQKSLSANTSTITLDSIPAGVSIEVRLEKSLIDQGVIAETLLPEGQDLDLIWP